MASRTRSTSPSVSPIELTRGLLDVSVTETMEFRTCRRRWHLSSIENLTPKRPTLSLEFGTGLHAALEQYYLHAHLDQSAAREHMQTAFTEWHYDTQQKLDRRGVDNDLLDEFYDLHNLGQRMLENYLQYDVTARVRLGKPVAVEGEPIDQNTTLYKVPRGYPPLARVTLHESGRILVPIVNPISKEPLEPRRLPGTQTAFPPLLTARIDLLTDRRTPARGLWIVDHKSAQSAPSDRGIDFDDQVTGYCYVVWRWTGRIPRGVVYNVLVKQEPKPPRLIGKEHDQLSTAKDQLTTPDLYRQALKDHGLISRTGRILSEKHAACLDALLERGWDPFFRRFEVTRNEHELLAYEERLFFLYQDMVEAHEDSYWRYPNPSTARCPGCPVNSICQAMNDGSDVDAIIEYLYTEGEDRKA